MTGSRKSERWLTPLLLGAVALTYRALYLVTVRDDPLITFVTAIPDASLFHNWAVNLLLGVKNPAPYYIGPAYAYFLAGLYKVFGVRLYAVVAAQLVLDATTAVALYGAARRLFGRGAGIVAGLVWAFYLPALSFAVQILPTALTAFAVALTLYLLAYSFPAAGERHAPTWGPLGAGAAFSVAVLARPNLILFVPALALWPLLRRARVWRQVLLFGVGVVLAATAVTVRNRVVAGDWVFISSQGGLNFYIGNNERADGAFAPPEGMTGRPEELNDAEARARAAEETGRPLAASAASRWWWTRGATYLLRNPERAAALFGRKAGLLANNLEVGLNGDFYFRRNFSVLHRLPIPYFALIFACGVVGLAVGRYRRGPLVTLLVVYVLAAAASVVLFFVADSYRFALVPALVVGAGYGVVAVADEWRRRRWAAAAAATGAGALLFTFSFLPFPGADAAASLAQSYVDYGAYYLAQGDVARAQDYFGGALRCKRDYANALFYLGVVAERRNRNDQAHTYYRAALLSNPAQPGASQALGALYAREGDYRTAAKFLALAVLNRPGNAAAWEALGECHVALGDYRSAAFAYERRCALTPTDAAPYLRYAEVLAASGDAGAAAAYARYRALGGPPHPLFEAGFAAGVKR